MTVDLIIESGISASQVCDYADTVATTAGLVARAAQASRTNKDISLSLSRRVESVLHVLRSGNEDSLGKTGLEIHEMQLAMQGLTCILTELLECLQGQARQSYISQILHLERNRRQLADFHTRLDNITQILNVRTTICAAELATATAHAVEQCATTRFTTSVPAVPTPRLPPRPLLHFGCDKTISIAASTVGSGGRVAILGGPGIGKTTLAAAVLHAGPVAARFGTRRYFIACDTALPSDQSNCLSLVAGALGIAAARAEVKQKKLLDALSTAPALLVLDNFESVWEDAPQKLNSEAFLEFLNGIDGVSVIVTLRGTERPLGMTWAKPYLPPLAPLPEDAAFHTFLSISGVDSISAAARELLCHLENVPLAITILASLAQYEAVETLLDRWKSESTSMLSRGAGTHRLDSLDVSILVSLSSPRINSHALELLGLLALLPHGIIDADLPLWAPVGFSAALSAILQTSLAFRDHDRVRVLSPIRAFISEHAVPSSVSLKALYAHYCGIANLSSQLSARQATSQPDAVVAIAPELGNIEAVVHHCLTRGDVADVEQGIRASISLCILRNDVGLGNVSDILPVAVAKAKALGQRKLTADLLYRAALLTENVAMAGDARALYIEANEIYRLIDDYDGLLDTGMYLIRWLHRDDIVSEAIRLRKFAEERNDLRRSARLGHRLAEAYSRIGRLQDACETMEGCIAQLSQAGAPEERLLGWSHTLLADYHSELGNGDIAIRTLLKALPLLRAAHGALGLAFAHLALADLYLTQGSVALSLENLQIALPLFEGVALGSRETVMCLIRLHQTHLAAGNEHEAVSVLERATTLVGRDDPPLVIVLREKGKLSRWRGDTDEARAMLHAADITCRRFAAKYAPEHHLAALTVISENLGMVDLDDGDRDAACTRFITAAVVWRASHSVIGVVRCLAALAEAVDDETSECLLGGVMLPLQRFGWRPRLASALLCSAGSALRKGDIAGARHRAHSSLAHYTSIGDARGMRSIELFLSGVPENVTS